MPPSKTKQIILVRKDLKLKRSHISSLIAKAGAELFIANDEGIEGDLLKVRLTAAEIDWINEGSPRVVLGVDSETVLRSIMFKAEISNIDFYPVTAVVRDEENNDTEGEEELIVVSLGPEESSKIEELTKGLKLF